MGLKSRNKAAYKQINLATFEFYNDFITNTRAWYIVDPFFYSIWIKKLSNKLMLSGKRHFIENLLINNLILLKKQKQKTTFFYLLDIIEITKPVLELYLKRRGKFFYKVPFPVDSIRQYKLSILFIGEAIKQKKFSNFKHAFFHETLNIIYSEKSLIYDKLKRIIETSVENRSYLHYRWWK